MEQFDYTPSTAQCVISVMTLFVVSALIVITVRSPRLMEKLLTQMPREEWISFEEVVGLGCSRFMACILLPKLTHPMIKAVEARRVGEDVRTTTSRGPNFFTAHLYEYKRVKDLHKRRRCEKKRKFDWSGLPVYT